MYSPCKIKEVDKTGTRDTSLIYIEELRFEKANKSTSYSTRPDKHGRDLLASCKH